MEPITPDQNKRVYALDALRAIMMLLGIVLHTGITYTVIDYTPAWILKDPVSQSLFFDVLSGFIHSFRMPVFFVAAGFFGALLFYKKGPKAMLANRFKRIVLPFIAGILVIYPMVFFAFAFTGEAFSGNPGALQDAWQLIVSGAFIPTIGVIHLWFLYFLAMFAVLAWALGMLFRKSTAFTNSVNSACRFVLQRPLLRLAVLIVPYFFCLVWMGLPGIFTNLSWKVDPATFSVYFLFFGCGWMIYKTNSLSYLAGGTWWQLVLATVLFFGTNVYQWPKEAWVLTVQQLSTAVSGTLFIFGFLALFLRYFNHYAPRLSYLMDAAYWVYIIHLPIAGLLPGIMAAWPISVFAKFGISFTLTTILSLASYHYLVRGSFIGMFLNGKVHPRKKLLKIEVATA
ncbi:MAG TPA: acyltransferase family protein [Panacibacter sp.]|nr:acyltransferase family protein [Panacibacter sp.]HNP46905.1 acyltransferase family protein [Panacibacter sp.]